MGTCQICGSANASHLRPYVGTRVPFDEGLSIVRCECGNERAEPMPRQAVLDQYYRSGAYEVQNAGMRNDVDQWQRGPARALAQVEMVTSNRPAAGSWLDVGAGYGFLLDEARSAGFSTSAVDATPTRRVDLGRRGHDVFPDVESVGGRFDVVSTSHFLEHVEDPVAFLATMATLLTDDGVLFCEVPNAADAQMSRHHEPHVYFFSPDGLGTTCTRAGLRVEQLRTAGLPRPLHRHTARLANVVSRAARHRAPDRWARFVRPEFRYGRDRECIRLLASRA